MQLPGHGVGMEGLELHIEVWCGVVLCASALSFRTVAHGKQCPDVHSCIALLLGLQPSLRKRFPLVQAVSSYTPSHCTRLLIVHAFSLCTLSHRTRFLIVLA